MGNKLDLNDQREVESAKQKHCEGNRCSFHRNKCKDRHKCFKAFIDISSRLKLDDESVSVDSNDGRGMHL